MMSEPRLIYGHGLSPLLWWIALLIVMSPICCQTDKLLNKVMQQRSSLQAASSSSRFNNHHAPPQNRRSPGTKKSFPVYGVKRKAPGHRDMAESVSMDSAPAVSSASLIRRYRSIPADVSEYPMNTTVQVDSELQYPVPDSDLSEYDEPYDYSSFQYSEFHEVFLCNHPPNKFSAKFLHHSQSQCEDYDSYHNINDLSTYFLCDQIYEMIYGKSYHPNMTWGIFLKNGRRMDLIHDESFVQLCLPLYRRLNNCEEKKYLTICEEEDVAFLHSHGCQPISHQDRYLYVMLAYAAMDESELCFQRICEGFMRIIESEVNNITFRIMEYDIILIKGNVTLGCYDYIAAPIGHIMIDNQTKDFPNRYFPSCYPYAYVLWTGTSDGHILRNFWEILPVSCKAVEVSMVVCVGLILLIGAVGNILVLVVMLGGKHRKEESSMLRISLAFGNLMMVVFVVGPSFYDHVMLISGYWYDDLKGDPMGDPNSLSTLSIINQTSSSQEGETASDMHTQYRIFQAIIFNVSVILSLLTLFVLSLERYIITGKSLKYKEYVSPSRIKCTIIIIWSLATIDGILFTIGSKGEISVAYMPMQRLPHGQSTFRSWEMDNVVTIRIIIFHTICGLTVLFSILSIRNFLKEKAKVSEEWDRLNMRVSGPYEEENSRILTSLLIMLLLFVISVIPFFFFSNFKTYQYYFSNWPFVEYVSWWLVIASSAWNPLIYNLRSHQFKADLRRLIQFRTH